MQHCVKYERLPVGSSLFPICTIRPEPAGGDEGSAHDGGQGQGFVQQDISQDCGKDDAGVVIDTHFRRWGLLIGIGQADLAAGTEDADEHQHHEIPGCGNHKTWNHQKTGGNGTEQGEVEDHGHGIHLAAAKGNHGIGKTAADRSQKGQYQRQCVGVKRGAHGRDSSDKTEQNDRNLHFGDPFPQEQQGKQAHPDGRGAVEHGNIGLPGAGCGIKEHDHADETEKRPGQ